MTRYTWGFAFLLMLMLSAVARSQTTDPSALTGLPSSLDASILGGTGADTIEQPLGLKDQLRSEFALLVTQMIHNLFMDLRLSLGLSATSVDPAGDPLAVLESIITGTVSTRLMP